MTYSPLTPHQERLWFIDAFERDHVYAGPPTYHNIPVWLWLDGVVEASLLEAALNDVVARHDALRTNVEPGPSTSLRAGPSTSLRAGRQRISADVRLTLGLRDLGSSTDEDVIALAEEDSGHTFLIEKDVLLRATFFRRSSARGLLALTVHHVVADLASTRLIVEDLLHGYRARVSGGDAPLVEAPTFAAYATWLRGLPHAAFDQVRAFWRWQLEGGVAPLELPYIRGRDRIHVYAPALWRGGIDGDLTVALDGWAARERVTLADVVRTAFVAALHACSRQREIVIGTSHPNRDRALERVVGPFANLLVLRHDVHPARPFVELLRHVERTFRQAVANRAMPFDRLVQELNPPKDMSRTALFDVFFQFLDEEPRTWTAPHVTVTRAESFAGYGKYDLHVTIRPAERGLAVDVQYNCRLFCSTFIADFMAIVESTLRRAADNPGAPLERHVRLPAALAAQQQALLHAEPGVRPAHRTLDAAFEAVAARSPDRIAIVSGDEHLTYRALAHGARRVARALVGAGVRSGTPVAAFFARSPQAMTALLGTLGAGATYVPVDPAYPAQRIAMLVEDSDAPVVLTTAALRAALAEHLGNRPVRVIEIETCGALSAAPLRSRSSSGDVAYSIYTSGSTGRPKGCLVTHANGVQLVLSQASDFAFGEDDAWSWCHSWCFDFSIWEIFGTLLHGGRGILLTREAVRDPGLLREALLRHEVSVLNQTPAAGYRLVEHLLAQDAPLPALRCLAFGGDVLTPARLAAWSTQHPHVAIVNMYGITETTVHVTAKRLASEEIAADSRSVGRALPNAATYIVGGELDLVAMGVLGEIAVSGDGVSLGYWKRPDLTAERFVPDPFSGRPGARLYRSGDEGRLLPSGEIEFSGRRDHQVKIRGYRIELGEIDKTIADVPGVTDAAVIAKDDGLGGRRLVAFVASADAALAPAAVRQHLQQRLTPAMIPGVIQVVSALPRTTTGKVDRRALQELELVEPAVRRQREAPRDDRERTLARIWEEVLARTPVHIDDNFFEIGGDSILCMQICARAARAGIALTPTLMFEHATIEEISSHLGAVVPTEAAASGREGVRALLPAQAWFFAQDQPDPHHFNQSAAFTLAPGVTAADVDAALRHLQAHHEALRTTFVRGDDGVRPYVNGSSADVPLIVVSLRGSTCEEREREALAAADATQRELDIYNGPLFRWLFIRDVDDLPSRLVMVFHHLIVDSVSWRTLVDDLDLLLDCCAQSRPLAALPPAASLPAYAAEATGREGQPPDTYRQVDAGAAVDVEAASLPVDLASSLDDNTFEHYAEHDASLDEVDTSAIAQALMQSRVGWEEALVAGAGEALLDWTAREDADLYIEGHGRERAAGSPDRSRTIGWFMKLHRVGVRQSQASAYEYLRDLRAELAQVKQCSGVFTSWTPGLCVNYLGQIDAVAGGARHLTLRDDGTGCAISLRNRRAQLIDVHAVLQRGRLRLRWGYCARIHRRETIAQLAAACAGFLRALPSSLLVARDYPLAPGQVGMLYHALLSEREREQHSQEDLGVLGDRKGVNRAAGPEYVVRSIFTIEGPLDVDAFRASWALLVDRHDALRASFASDGLDGPVQRFAEHATLACPVYDWRELDAAAQQTRLNALVEETARRGLDLTMPPLVSLQLARTAHETHVALLQMHHLVIDGWSLAILREELLRAYAALHEGRAVAFEPAGRFRDYLQHVQAQDRGAAERFWRERLQGVRPCPWPAAAGEHTAPVLESRSVDILDRPLARHDGLIAWAAHHHLTLNTIVQGVWCLALGCLTRRADVVTGVVVAGRPADLPGVERTVGAFINTLPLRAQLDMASPLARWLARLQEEFVQAQRCAGSALPELSAWAGLPKDRPLFDTVLVCENYPAPALPADSPVRMREERYAIKESVPVVLEYSCGARLVARLRYRPDLASAASIDDAGALVRAGIDAVERDPEMTVGALASVLEDAESRSTRRRQDRFAAARRRVFDALRAGAERSPATHDAQPASTERVS